MGIKQIHFSKKSLRCILFNLISNGIKFTGIKKPIIEINIAEGNGKMLLSVQDNDIGISEAALKRIFEKYGS